MHDDNGKLIDWGPHQLNVLYKYGQYHGPYSMKLYKSLVYNRASQAQCETDTLWQTRTKHAVWGVKAEVAKTAHLAAPYRGHSKDVKYHNPQYCNIYAALLITNIFFRQIF